MMLLKLAAFDIRKTVANHRFVLVALLAYLFYGVWTFLELSHGAANLDSQTARFSLVDLLAYLNKGMKVYDPRTSPMFLLDLGWMIPLLLICFSVCLRSVSDRETYAVQLLTRTKSRTAWFMMKVVWVLFLTTAYYAAMILVSWAASLFCGDPAAADPTIYSSTASGIDLSAVQGHEVWMALALGYAATVATALLLMCVVFALGPIWSYLVLIVGLVSTAYYHTYLLFFGFVMISRNSIAIPHGFNSAYGLETCLLLCVASIAGGLLASRRVEYL